MPHNLTMRRAEEFVVLLTLTYPVSLLYGSERTVCTLINAQTRSAQEGLLCVSIAGTRCSWPGRAARPHPGGPSLGLPPVTPARGRQPPAGEVPAPRTAWR